MKVTHTLNVAIILGIVVFGAATGSWLTVILWSGLLLAYAAATWKD